MDQKECKGHDLPPFAKVTEKAAPQSRLLRAWRLGGGISAEMTALEIERPGGQTERFIVRRRGDGDYEHNQRIVTREFKLLQVLQPSGLPTPVPLLLDTSGEALSSPYMILDFVEGSLDFAPADLTDCVLQLAANLAKIHSLDPARLDLSFLPLQTPRCSERLGSRPTQVDDSLAEGRLRGTLAAVEQPPQRNAPVLLHGDYWPGNVLWHDEKLVAVIDWEDAQLGEPLADVANSRLEIAWIFGLEAMEAFTGHYRRLMDIDYVGLAYWDLCAALRLARLAGSDLAQWAAFFAPYGRHDITEHTIKENYGSFVGRALESLEAS